MVGRDGAGPHFMVPVDAEHCDGELCQLFFSDHVTESAMKIDAGVTQDNEGVVRRRIHSVTESLDSAEFAVGVPGDVEHDCSSKLSHFVFQASAASGHSMHQYR